MIRNVNRGKKKMRYNWTIKKVKCMFIMTWKIIYDVN